jgi:hypothetical protein
LSQELITYIVLGSHERLKGLKAPTSSSKEEYIFANFSENETFEETIDTIVFNSKGN